MESGMAKGKVNTDDALNLSHCGATTTHHTSQVSQKVDEAQTPGIQSEVIT